MASDPLIWEQHPDKSRSEPEGFRAFFQQALASGGALVALDAATGAVVGSSRFHGHDADAGEVEIGWTFLARSHWGGRYNREMKRLMLAHCFRYVERVDFRIGENNLRSRRAMEKIGGHLSARDGGVVQTVSGPARHVVYEITRESFAGGPLMRS